ncbi:MoaD/ThiS family protein [Aureispira]|nr:MoaD/ThiS family protein [Aureispira sp.]
MEITINYFGMLSEITNKNNETLKVPENCNTEDLNNLLKQTYPSISHISYTIALNKKIIQKTYPLSSNDEIALLPPFAGG